MLEFARTFGREVWIHMECKVDSESGTMLEHASIQRECFRWNRSLECGREGWHYLYLETKIDHKKGCPR